MRRVLCPIISLCVLAACGDDTTSSGSEAGSDTSVDTTSATDTASTSGGSASESMGTTDDSGTAGESEGSSSSTSSETTSVTSAGSTTSTSTSTTGSTTEGPPLCGPVSKPAGPVDIDPECEGTEVEEVVDPWNFSVEWQYQSAGNGVIVMPAVGNLTDDNNDGVVDVEDTPDIAVNTWTEGALVALHGDGSGEIFKITGINGGTGPAIADVDSDGVPEVVTLNSQSRMIAVDGTGSIEWTSPVLSGLSYYPQITVADLDEDGDVEVIVDVHIIDGATGAMVAKMNATGPYRTPIVADLDLDGSKEIILHSGVFSSTGTNLWTIPGTGDAAFAAVANIDDDPEAEVFVNYGSKLYVHEHDGTLIGSYPIPNNTNLSGPPCMADFDGDGEVEIAVPAGARFNMMETDGTLIWQATINDSSGAAGCSGYDVNGDGTYEVMFADQDALRIYDGPSGTVVYVNETHSSGTVWEYPVVADVDKDGSGEIIIASNGTQRGVTVFGHGGDGWAAAGPTWPVHDFAVTNVNPDGSVPQSPEPSWEKLNVFRARPVVDDPALPDLFVEILDTCVDCDAEVYISYQVCNQGDLDVDAGTPLTLFAVADGVEVVVESITLEALQKGMCLAADSFVFAPELIVDGPIILRLYDDGNGTEPEIECQLDNDQAVVELTSCDDIPG